MAESYAVFSVKVNKFGMSKSRNSWSISGHHFDLVASVSNNLLIILYLFENYKAGPVNTFSIIALNITKCYAKIDLCAFRPYHWQTI